MLIVARNGAPCPVGIPMQNDSKKDIARSVARKISMSQDELTKYIRRPQAESTTISGVRRPIQRLLSAHLGQTALIRLMVSRARKF